MRGNVYRMREYFEDWQGSCSASLLGLLGFLFRVFVHQSRFEAFPAGSAHGEGNPQTLGLFNNPEIFASITGTSARSIGSIE